MEEYANKFMDMLAVHDSQTNFVSGGPPASNKLTAIRRMDNVRILKDHLLTGGQVDFTDMYDPSATAVYVEADPDNHILQGSTYLHFRFHSEVRV